MPATQDRVPLHLQAKQDNTLHLRDSAAHGLQFDKLGDKQSDRDDCQKPWQNEYRVNSKKSVNLDRGVCPVLNAQTVEDCQ